MVSQANFVTSTQGRRTNSQSRTDHTFSRDAVWRGGVPGRREPDTEPSGIVCRLVWKAVRLVALVSLRVGAGSVGFFDTFLSSEWL